MTELERNCLSTLSIDMLKNLAKGAKIVLREGPNREQDLIGLISKWCVEAGWANEFVTDVEIKEFHVLIDIEI